MKTLYFLNANDDRLLCFLSNDDRNRAKLEMIGEVNLDEQEEKESSLELYEYTDDEINADDNLIFERNAIESSGFGYILTGGLKC